MQMYLFVLLLSVACHAPQPRQGSQPERTDRTRHRADSLPVRLNKQALLGKLNPAQDSSFVLIDTLYTDKPGIYLRKAAYKSFVRMSQAAHQAGISLRIISATRNFASQKRIWEAKWNGQRKVDGQNLSQVIPIPTQRALKILEYSSMPGTSRHHWGTDIDLNALSNSYFASAEGKAEYDWLQENAATYGFCQVYTEQGEDRPDGYQEEKWHWSYMPLAQQFLQQYNAMIHYDDLGGFNGGKVAEEVGAIEKYVNGIAPECRGWGK